jgi:hypothetical protein
MPPRMPYANKNGVPHCMPYAGKKKSNMLGMPRAEMMNKYCAMLHENLVSSLAETRLPHEPKQKMISIIMMEGS